MSKIGKIQNDVRGSISIEFALVTALFLIPLVLLGFDALFLMMGYEQIGQVTHSVIMYAWSFPSDANYQKNINEVISANSQDSIGTFTLENAPSESFDCLQSNGSKTTAASDGACTNGQSETLVSYKIVLALQLPFTIGLVPNPYQITSNVTVRIE